MWNIIIMKGRKNIIILRFVRREPAAEELGNEGEKEEKGDYSSILGQFDDAGKAKAMEKLLKKEGLKESWRMVKKAYQKMEKGKK